MDSSGGCGVVHRPPFGSAGVTRWGGGELRMPRGRYGGRFADEGHVRYYNYAPPVAQPRWKCGGGGRRRKEEAKLLPMRMGGGPLFLSTPPLSPEAADPDGGHTRIISTSLSASSVSVSVSEAADVLLARLKQMRDEEKKMKKKRKKEEKAARKKKDCRHKDEDTSSSSSSESSDSDCETVVKMSAVRDESAQAEPAPEAQLLTAVQATCCSAASLPLQLKTEVAIDENKMALKPKQDCRTRDAAQNCCNTGSAAVEKNMDRIEVCMGGKCKKSGAIELLGEFDRKIGIQGAVVGCKCMGKCKDGPNVRVLNHNAEEDSSKPVKNPLCIGVGLEDVSRIVAKFLNERNDDVGLMPA